MKQALILGTGGHCRVILSLLDVCGEHEVLGIIELGKLSVGENIMGIPVLGNASCLDEFCGRSNLDIFLAIGDNEIRQIWWKKTRELGFRLPNLISPYANIDCRAKLGEANVVCANVFIGPGAILCDNNLVNTGAIVEHEVLVGSHCHLAPSSTIAGRSRIGDECFIGAAATVIDGLSVEDGTTLGAGATLIRNISEIGGVYVGTPAKKR